MATLYSLKWQQTFPLKIILLNGNISFYFEVMTARRRLPKKPKNFRDFLRHPFFGHKSGILGPASKKIYKFKEEVFFFRFNKNQGRQNLKIYPREKNHFRTSEVMDTTKNLNLLFFYFLWWKFKLEIWQHCLA